MGQARVGTVSATLSGVIVAPLDDDEPEECRHIHSSIEADASAFEPGGELSPKIECNPPPALAFGIRSHPDLALMMYQ